MTTPLPACEALLTSMVPTVAMSTGEDLQQFCTGARPRLVGALSLYVGDAGVAEELANEALLRAVDRWGEVQLMANPHGWAHTVAFNLARSRLRRMAAERRAYARLAARRRAPAAPDVGDVLAIRAALGHLPNRQRQAIVCRYYLDMSAAEIATAMNCSAATVKVHLRSALVTLREQGLGLEGEEL